MRALLRMIYEENKDQFLLDITSLFYDIELMHDLSVILSYEQYKEFEFSQFFYYRSGRPLILKHRLRAFHIIKKSPLTLELIVGAVGGLWILLQTFEKISNWKLNKEKLRLEVKKLTYETNIKELYEKKTLMDLEAAIQQRNASNILYGLIKRLESNPIQLSDMDIEILEGADES